jgi:hypothetical protein
METYIVESYLVIKGKREPRTAVFLSDPVSNLVEAIIPQFNILTSTKALGDLSDDLTIAALDLKRTGSPIYTGGLFSESNECAFYECGTGTIHLVNFSELVSINGYSSWEKTSNSLIGKRIASTLQYIANKTGKKVKISFLEM